jgi:hypothetical protein
MEIQFLDVDDIPDTVEAVIEEPMELWALFAI